MKKILGNYNMPILIAIVLVDVALYLTNIISVVPYLLVAVGGFFLVTWGKINHVKEMNGYLEKDLDPDKFLKELAEYEKFNNFGKQKTNLLVAKMVAYLEIGDYKKVNALLAEVSERDFSKDLNLALNMHRFYFFYYMNKKEYDDAEEQLAEMGEVLEKIEKKDKNAFEILSAQYDILDAEHDFYSAKTKEEREEYFTAFETQQTNALEGKNSARGKLLAEYNLGKGYYIMKDYDKAKEYFEKVVGSEGKLFIVEDSKKYIEKIEKKHK